MRVEYNNCDLTVTQNTQFIRLLHQPKFSLGEGDLSISLVGDPGDVDLLPAHVG